MSHTVHPRFPQVIPQVDANPQVHMSGLQRCAASALIRTTNHMLMQGWIPVGGHVAV